MYSNKDFVHQVGKKDYNSTICYQQFIYLFLAYLTTVLYCRLYLIE